MDKKKIVILGAGFAGMYTYRALKRKLRSKEASITVVNKTNHFLFTPLLHEVASGSLTPVNVVESIRSIMDSNDCFYQAEVLGVNSENKTVQTNHGDISYDYLVYALGSRACYFNTPGAHAYAYSLKSLEDAVYLRNHVIDKFEQATCVDDEKEKEELLSFVIVGGGPTGVEYAGELIEYIRDTFKKYYPRDIDFSKLQVTLVHMGGELLPQFDKKLRGKALARLKKQGVTVLLNTAVEEINKKGVQLKGGDSIVARTVVWTAGVEPNTQFLPETFERDPRGRVIVNEFLQTGNDKNIFVVGDVASSKNDRGEAMPQLAQVAVRHGEFTADTIARIIHKQRLLPFDFRLQGELVSVGEWYALGKIGFVRLSGAFAWYIWRTIYLFKFHSFRKRLRIALDWTINLFYPRDISKL
ncbi:MAG: NAD(P)/FAD-dependent oxidoreductase [Candidatus Paceibacterota bacterium]